MIELAILLVGLVVGAGLQALTGWLTDKRAERREHRQWLRSQQYIAFNECVTACWHLVHTLQTTPDPIQLMSAFARFRTSAAAIKVVAAPAIVVKIEDILKDLTGTVSDYKYRGDIEVLNKANGHVDRLARLLNSEVISPSND